MRYFLKGFLFTLTSSVILTSAASAQYYNPAPTSQYPAYQSPHQPGGAGVDIGLRNSGFNPSVGVGIGQLGVGVGTGIGRNGIGEGVNVGVGPLGVSTDAGLGRNGLGARVASGIGNTGASVEGGLSNGGLGFGTSAKVVGFGGGISAGLGSRGPGLGASVAFGRLGTLLLGSHRNSYPGAQQTATYTHPSQSPPYYAAQNYGNAAYYKAAPSYQHRQAQYAHRPHTHHPQPVTAQGGYYQRPVVQHQYVPPKCSGRWSC